MESAYGIRRIGWAQEPYGSLLAHPTCSRLAFIASRSLYAAVNFLVFDLITAFEAGNLRTSTFGSWTHDYLTVVHPAARFLFLQRFSHLKIS